MGDDAGSAKGVGTGMGNNVGSMTLANTVVGNNIGSRLQLQGRKEQPS